MDKKGYDKEMKSIEADYKAIFTEGIGKALKNFMVAFEDLDGKQKMFKDIYYKGNDLLSRINACEDASDELGFDMSDAEETLGTNISNILWIGEEMEKVCQKLKSISYTVEDVDYIFKDITK